VASLAGVTSLSCAATWCCVAVHISGNVITEHNGDWSVPQNVNWQTCSRGFTGGWRPTIAFRAAVDYDGNASPGDG
jgi:hypothetical protein